MSASPPKFSEQESAPHAPPSSITSDSKAAVPPPSEEGAVAARNALKLGASLLATWGVALVVRFQLPRYLGPEDFGQYSFSEGFAAAIAVVLTLGVDTYSQRELPVRPKHASDYFGAVVMLRLAMMVPLGLLMWFGAHRAGHGEVALLALMFGAIQFMMSMNSSFAVMLQASTQVNALAVQNVVSKLLWGAGVAILIALGAPLITLALPFFLSETLKCYVLYNAAKRAIGLRFRVQPSVLFPILKASFPFFLSMVAVALVNRVDIALLGFLASPSEVGWYGSAQNIAGLAMLLSPLISWIFMPLFARANHRSPEEFFALLRRALEGLLVVAIPITTILALGADLWISIAFGQSFAPAARALTFLAPIFTATYLAMLLASALIVANRAWQLTFITLGSLLVQVAMILFLTPILAKSGPGGAGAGVGIAVTFTEILSAVALLIVVGKRSVDARSVYRVGMSLGAALVVALCDRLVFWSLGPVRVLLDIGLYALIVLSARAVRISDVLGAIAFVRSRRKRPEPQVAP